MPLRGERRSYAVTADKERKYVVRRGLRLAVGRTSRYGRYPQVPSCWVDWPIRHGSRVFMKPGRLLRLAR